MEYFHIFLYIAFVLIVALGSTRLMKVLKLPNVTGYIITGIIVGPFVFGLFFNNFTFDGIKDGVIYQYVNKVNWISNIALGFIAFSIGTSFKKSMIKSVGKRVLIITIFEALFASIAVIIALLILHLCMPNEVSISTVLTLGAIASATAPAATLMVIKQYKARGKLVDTLLPVVALDDAAALILFAILFQAATTLTVGGDFSFYKMIIKPIIEILVSLGIGIVFGFIISFLNKFFKSRNNRLILIIFSIFASAGLYHLFRCDFMGGFELSNLLMCMCTGAIFTNMRQDSGKTLDLLDRFTTPIYLLFFVISGASLDLTIFTDRSGLIVILIAAIYIVTRMVGKWSGAFTGAVISKCEPEVKKYLGFALAPQAGVAIGLATTANSIFSENPETAHYGAIIIAVILTSTLIYELFGPTISKFALEKSNQIPKEESQA